LPAPALAPPLTLENAHHVELLRIEMVRMVTTGLPWCEWSARECRAGYVLGADGKYWKSRREKGRCVANSNEWIRMNSLVGAERNV
jgi:hypothetical protein